MWIYAFTDITNLLPLGKDVRQERVCVFQGSLYPHYKERDGMEFGNKKRVVEIWYTKRLYCIKRYQNDDSNISTIVGSIQYVKIANVPFLFPLRIVIAYSFFQVHPHWGHFHKHEKQSL